MDTSILARGGVTAFGCLYVHCCGFVARFCLYTCSISLQLYFQVVSGVCFLYAFWPSDFFQRAFGVCILIIEFFGPLCVLIYCYGRIVWILTRRMDSNLDKGCQQTNTFQLARKNTVKTFLIISVCFIICWSSVEVSFLMYNIGYTINWEGTFNMFATLMAFVNCTINPFIYLIKYKDYQIALMVCLGYKKQNDGKYRTTLSTVSSQASGVNTISK